MFFVYFIWLSFSLAYRFVNVNVNLLVFLSTFGVGIMVSRCILSRKLMSLMVIPLLHYRESRSIQAGSPHFVLCCLLYYPAFSSRFWVSVELVRMLISWFLKAIHYGFHDAAFRKAALNTVDTWCNVTTLPGYNASIFSLSILNSCLGRSSTQHGVAKICVNNAATKQSRTILFCCAHPITVTIFTL